MDETACGRIKELRKTLGLTQDDFADRLKISRAYLCKIEQNRSRINERILNLIALVYGANARWLETGEGAMFDETKDRRLEEVVENFKNLDDLLQDYVLKQIRLAREYQDQRKARREDSTARQS
jgi:transcriptional regulator with XRE-family HTH domain